MPPATAPRVVAAAAAPLPGLPLTAAPGALPLAAAAAPAAPAAHRRLQQLGREITPSKSVTESGDTRDDAGRQHMRSINHTSCCLEGGSEAATSSPHTARGVGHYTSPPFAPAAHFPLT